MVSAALFHRWQKTSLAKNIAAGISRTGTGDDHIGDDHIGDDQIGDDQTKDDHIGDEHTESVRLSKAGMDRKED